MSAPASESGSRFSYWASFLVISAITLGSAVEITNGKRTERASAKEEGGEEGLTSNERWAVVCSAMTFTVIAITVIVHLVGSVADRFVGTKLEGIVCFILIIFWAANAAVVSDAENGLAMSDDLNVGNGNLYYFSWAGFICSVTLLVSYLRSAFDLDVAGEFRNRGSRLTLWAAHLATSLVVMGSSANIFEFKCVGEGSGGNEYCRRAEFGISLGTIATVMCLVVIALKLATSRAPFLLESIFSGLLLVLYGLGVCFLTSDKGPGKGLGNLYYFSWGSFVTALMLVASCFDDYQNASGTPDGDIEAQKEVPVEDLDDDQL